MEEDDLDEQGSGEGVPQKDHLNRGMRDRLAKEKEKQMQLAADYEARLAQEAQARQLAEQRAQEALAQAEEAKAQLQEKKFTETDVKQLAYQLNQETQVKQNLEDLKNKVLGAAEKDEEFKTLLAKSNEFPMFQQYMMATALKDMPELPGVIKHILTNPQELAYFNAFNPNDPASERDFIRYMTGLKDKVNPIPVKGNQYSPAPNLSSGGGGLDDDEDDLKYMRERYK